MYIRNCFPTYTIQINVGYLMQISILENLIGKNSFYLVFLPRILSSKETNNLLISFFSVCQT